MKTYLLADPVRYPHMTTAELRETFLLDSLYEPGALRTSYLDLDRAIADSQSRDWTLVVLHDIPTGAMDHLEEFIGFLEREGFEFTQEFPPDCVPILDGKVVLPLDPYVNG